MLKKLIEKKLKEFEEEFSYVGWIPENKEHILDFIEYTLTEASKEAIKQTKFNKRCELCCAAKVCYGFCEKALEEQQKRIDKYLT